jgi:hypothetical protein
MPGASISQIEVTKVDSQRIRLSVEGREYFLPYRGFSWFKESRRADVLNVELYSGGHIYWPALDVGLSTTILQNPNHFPLKLKKSK